MKPSVEPTKNPAAGSDLAPAPGPLVSRNGRWILLVILVVAAYLRVSHVGLLEFKADEANAAIMAVKFAKGQMFPQVGLTYSVGVRQAPLYIYLLTPFFALNGDPAFFTICYGLISALAVGGCFLIGRRFFNERVGLVAAALFAVSPWAVVYSRKVWPQDFLPVICTALLWMWCEFLIHKKRGYLFGIVLLSVAAAQIHLTATNLVALLVALWLVCRFPLNAKLIGLGLAVNLALVLPYISFQMQHDWEDFHKATSVVQAHNREEVYTVQGIHPQWGFPFPSRDHFGHLLNTVGGGQLEDILGLSTTDFLAQAGLLKAGVTLGKLLFVAALLTVAVAVARRARPSPTFPYFDLSSDPRLTVLLLWVLMPVVFFSLTGLRSYLSYFALTLPAVFLLMAWLIDTGTRYFRLQGSALLRGVGVPVLWIVFGAMWLSQLTQVMELYGYLEREGGARGTYGVVYGEKRLLVERIAQEAQVTNPIVSRDWPPQTPVENDLQYMLRRQLEHRSLPENLPAGQTQTAFVVIDARFETPKEPLTNMQFEPFGPLHLYRVKFAPPPR